MFHPWLGTDQSGLRIAVHYEQLLMEKNMSGYSATMRMERAQKPEVNRCGDCGVEISDSQILCQDCLWSQIDGKAYDEKTISGECIKKGSNGEMEKY